MCESSILSREIDQILETKPKQAFIHSPELNLSTLEQSNAILSLLEGVGAILMHEQYYLSVSELQALNRGEMPSGVQSWLDANASFTFQIQRYLSERSN